jgi:hypothetical protein
LLLTKMERSAESSSMALKSGCSCKRPSMASRRL